MLKIPFRLFALGLCITFVSAGCVKASSLSEGSGGRPLATSSPVASDAASAVKPPSSAWPTFSDPEDFYSIQYPQLGTFFVQYSALPLRTTLGWKGVSDFDITIDTIDTNGLHLHDWLKRSHGIDTIIANVSAVQTLTVNGMDCVVVFAPTAGEVTAYVEQEFFGEPLMHVITFNSYTNKDLYPPFWNTMLHTFRGLAEEQ